MKPKKLNLLERIGLSVLSVFGLVKLANAGDIKIINNSPNVAGSSMNIKNIEGATEGYDASFDFDYNPSGTSKLRIYSFNPNCLPYTDKLSIDSRGINSVTPFHNELYCNDNGVDAQNFIKFKIQDNTHLEWKTIFAERYGLDDINDVNNVKNVWDVKIVNNTYLQLPDLVDQSQGVYDNILRKDYNHADLNRDGKVDFKDYAIFANNWKRIDYGCKRKQPKCFRRLC